ncbi:MAG: ABC transporter permease, partial [Candidatus Aminicenantes bacterium]|nr:ABC transporter permease [Candidatus Aminicenantes bacterium]
MFKNYFKTTFRCIARQKTFPFINILGMGIALACCLLILLFIGNELTYDSFHKDFDLIYRVYSKSELSGKIRFLHFSPAPLAGSIQNEAAGVDKLARVGVLSTHWVTAGDKSIKSKITPADSSFFELFSFPLKNHNYGPEILDSSSDVVISNEVAKKLFAEEEPVGKSIKIHQMGDFIITGVMKEIPANSSLDFDVLININHISKGNLESWGSFMVETYLKLHNNVSQESLEVQFSGIAEKYIPENIMSQRNTSFHL